MDDFFRWMEVYSLEIIGAAVFLTLIASVFVMMNWIRTTRLMRRYKRLMRGVDNKNLEALLYHHLDELQASMTRIKDIELSIHALERKHSGCVQRIGVVRYNAFEQMGGDQSFSIAFLDGLGSGVVMTNLYGRNTSTVFAKPITNHQSSYALSKEEQEALRRCMPKEA